MNRTKTLYAALLLLLAPAVSDAQAPDCTYDRCALAMWGWTVLQGAETTPVSSDLLRTAGHETGYHYRMARRDRTRASVLLGMSIATMIGTLVYHGGDRDWSTPAGIGLPAGMLVSWAGAVLFATRGENHMRRAIWYYNKPLAGTSGSEASACPYVECALRLRGSWIVQGETGTPVAKAGSESGLALFATAPDSNARVSYEGVLATRKSEAASRWLALGVAAAGAAVAVAGNGETTEDVGMGLLFAASILMPQDKLGHKAKLLERAIWLYNRQLSGGR